MQGRKGEGFESLSEKTIGEEGRFGNEELVMPESPELPPNTIVVCPQCGTKNTRTDTQCRKCDADLTAAKQSIASELGLPPMPQIQVPFSFEQQVLTKLDRIERDASDNHGFIIILFILSVITLLLLIF